MSHVSLFLVFTAVCATILRSVFVSLGSSCSSGACTSSKLSKAEGWYAQRTWRMVAFLMSVGTAAVSPTYAAAQAAHFSAAQSTIAAGFSLPAGVAVDSAGNVYITEEYNDRVLKETLSGGTYTQSLVANLNSGSHPNGIAVDANGTLYVAAFGSNQLLKETPSAGGYVQSVVQTSGLHSPSAVIVDNNGTLYIADSGNSRIIKESPVGNGYSENVVVNNLHWPAGLAMDPSGSLYIAEYGDSTLLKETPSTGGHFTQSTIPTPGLNRPCGIDVDASGNVYVTDSGNNRVLEEVSSGGSYTQTVVPANGLSGVVDIKVDAAGSLYVADAYNNNRVVLLRKGGLNFGSVSVAITSSASSLLFTFDSATTLGAAPIVSTQGTIGLDFAAASSGTCVAGQSYNAGDTCSVDLKFNPLFSGPRYGAAVLQGNAGQALATGYAYGIGTGPQVSFAPGVQSIVATGLSNPRGLIADGSGNLYVADTDHGRVLKETYSGGTYTESTIASTGLAFPIGIAVDGAGSVYIGDCYNGRIVKETVSGKAYTESTVVSGIGCPGAIAFDGSGDMYIVQSRAGGVLLETPSASGYIQKTIISGNIDAKGIAIDTSGNLYIANADYNSTVLKETLTHGAYVSSVVSTSTLNQPRQLAVDAFENVFIADASNGRVLKESLTGGRYVESVIIGGLNEADSVALDALGNVYIADTYHRQVLKLDYADAPNLTFAATGVGTTSSAQTVMLQNIGNSPLAFPAPASGSNPAVSANYSVDGSVANACPQTSANQSAGASLAPGASCALAISFTPATIGASQVNVVIGDTNMNAANALQTIIVAGTGSVTPTSLFLSAPASAIYGDPVQVAASVTGGQTNNAVSSGTVAFSDPSGSFGSKTVVNGSATQSYLAPSVGSFTLQGAYSPSSPNYTKSTGQATIQITAAPLNLLANGATRTYGAANPQFAGSITGAVNGDSFVEAFKTSATASSPIASYPIVPSASGTNLNNYTQNVQNGALQVTAAELNLTANDATRAYGAANPQFTGTMAGVVNNDSLTETFTTAATNASSVATYSIVPGVSGAAASNYTPTVKTGTLTISPAGLSVSANDATRTYGAANPQFAGAVTGMVNGDQFAEIFTTAATQSSPVAAYSIVPSASGPALSNYNPAIHNGTLTVTPAALGVKANDATRTYGAANPALTGTVTGMVSGDDITATYTTSATGTSPAATYPIVPSLAGQSLRNYTQSATNGTLTVSPADLTVKANDAAKTYGAANPQFSGSIAGAVNGDAFAETFTTSAASTSPVTTYTIVPAASGADLSNYTQSVNNGTLTINPAALTVKANDNTRVYGTSNPQFTGTVSGMVNGDAFTEAFTTTATQASPVASYAIVPTAAGPNLTNYNQTAINGTLTIIPATLTLSADSLTRVYSAMNPAFTGSFTGAAAGDQLQQSYSTTATAASPAGSYSIIPAVTGNSVNNYVQVVKPGTLTVKQAALHFTANDATRPYGQNPTFVGSVTGAAAGDQIAEQFTTAANFTSFPGTYPIVPSVTGSTLANYLSTATNGTLTITPVTLTATVQNVTRVYGAANPSFQGVVTGAVNHDSITETFTTSATAQSPVGTYAIKPVLAGANLAGYAPTLVEGTLTIVPAPLVATAASTARSYGTANPAMWGSLTGVVNGDTLPASYSTTAKTTDTVGQYPIMASVTGNAISNYTLSVVPGVLAVQKAGTFITLDPQKGTDAADAAIQLQAHVVSGTTGVPSGTVRFYNGKHLLGEATLQNGTAVYSTGALSVGGSNTLTAVYQADANFLASSSEARSITIQGTGFSVKRMGLVTMTVQAGNQAAFSLNADPGTTNTYPDVVTFAVAGLPDGATATFSPATLAADSGNQTVVMTVQTKASAPAAATAGMAHADSSWESSSLVGGSALALVLLPFAGACRLRKAGMGMLLTLLLILGGMAGSMALTGCGVTRNTAFANTPNAQPATYVLTVTATSGGVQQTATETLTVQP